MRALSWRKLTMKNRHTLYPMILLCATLPVLLGCIPIGSVINPDDERELGDIQFELNLNRAKWTSAMVSDYQFNFRWICFCAMESMASVNITVRENRIDSAAFMEGGAPVAVGGLEGYRTIDGLFDLLQEGIDKNAHSISVDYHPELGYPIDVWIDYEEATADEELGFEIDSLVVE